jgi:hypothetical protein
MEDRPVRRRCAGDGVAVTSFPRPGVCPVCGVFVSVRTRHVGHCVPPAAPSDSVPWTGRSPMLAWPSSHRFVRRGRTWCTSPVPGIGPRLLVVLAQHRSAARRDLPGGKRARYGPSHALQDLLEMTPEAVLDEVLRPAPAWVPCGGTWHRVLLWDGQLWAMDHGDIDLESERVAAVIARERLTGCTAAMANWMEHRPRRRLSWLIALDQFDTAASWGVDELAWRDSWIEAAVRSADVRDALPFGIGAEELLSWVGWLRDPAKIAAWRAAGWTSSEAAQLTEMCLLPQQTVAWREAGLDVGVIREGMEYEFGPSCAADWWRAGFSLRDADMLISQEVDLEEAIRRKDRYGSAARVATLARMSA